MRMKEKREKGKEGGKGGKEVGGMGLNKMYTRFERRLSHFYFAFCRQSPQLGVIKPGQSFSYTEEVSVYSMR